MPKTLAELAGEELNRLVPETLGALQFEIVKLRAENAALRALLPPATSPVPEGSD